MQYAGAFDLGDTITHIAPMQLTTILRAIQKDKRWKRQGALAKALRVSQPTISRWYSGKQKPEIDQRDRIMELAAKLGVIHNGENGSSYTVPIIGFVGAGGQILYGEGQGPFGEATMPPDGSNPATVAVKVRGDSMVPQLEDGWLVFYDNRQEPPTDALFKKLCVIGLPDGRVLVKRLLPGSNRGLFHLLSVNGDHLLDQAVAWAAKVSAIIPD